MLEIVNFRKATYINNNLLHYLSFNEDAIKFTWYLFNFSLLLTLNHPFGSCANPLWTSLIIVYRRSVEKITSLALLYITCPWSIESGTPFQSWLSFLYLSLYKMDRCFYASKYVSISLKLTWCSILQTQNLWQFICQKKHFFQNNMFKNVQRSKIQLYFFEIIYF